ncbi:hypothetical protein [Corynebacterium faecium]|uniref:hypothetical protein n=1 Tax=Corynebacterium faecium TaxID=3016001 RepID=UPI0022B3A009|nr:hypothetical protein [Corynebacterium faecium]
MTFSVARRVRTLAVSLLLAAAAAAGFAVPAQAVAMYAGDSIRVAYSDGSRYGCSLNTVAHRGGRAYGVTAGHCLAPIGGAVPVAVYAADGRTKISGDLRESGYEMRGDNKLGSPLRDVAWFPLAGDATNAAAVRGGAVDIPVIGAVNPLSDAVQRINPTRRVAGYHPVTAVKPGQIVCKDGARTSRTCGPVLKVNPDTGELAVLILALHGDSGGPVYTVNPDGSANIIGVVSGTAFGVLLAVDGLLPLPAGLR